MSEGLTIKPFAMVEATDLEELTIWKDWHERLSWQQNVPLVPCCIRIIGEFHGEPVAVRVSWAMLNNRLIGFYSASSQVVDHRMIDKWQKSLDAQHHSDAMNFGRIAMMLNPKPEVKS